MANERDFEEVLAHYPEMIEEGLRLIGRQVTVCGRRIDLLFEDRFKQKLVVELKWGPIKDEHVGQIMYYQGALLSGPDPVRTMLVGTRVPPAIQKSLDFNGLACKEIRLPALVEFLRSKGETDLLRAFEADLPLSEAQMKSKLSSPAAIPADAPHTSLSGSPALFAPVAQHWLDEAVADFRDGKKRIRFGCNSRQLGPALKYKDLIEKVYFKPTGRGEISACARFLGIDQGNPSDDTGNPSKDRLSGSKSTDDLWRAWYYYGFCDLDLTIAPIPLASIRRYSNKPLLGKNNRLSACVIRDIVAG
jgi:hypothetical protein